MKILTQKKFHYY